MDRPCFIVGGGPSLQGFDYDILKGRDVIAVNQSIFRIPSAQWFVTMDYTWLQKSEVLRENRLTRSRGQEFCHHPAKKVFVLAFSEPRFEEISPSQFIDHRYNMKYDLSMFDHVVRVSQYGGIGETFKDFRAGSDSGYAALQLAAVLGYKNIYLLGFDFCILGDKTHGHSDYGFQDPIRFETKLKEFMIPYPQAFEILRSRGVQVYSGSHISRLNRYILYVDVKYLLSENLV